MSRSVKIWLIFACILRTCRCDVSQGEDEEIAAKVTEIITPQSNAATAGSGRSFSGETFSNSETTKQNENGDIERAFNLNGLADGDFRAHSSHTFSKQAVPVFGTPQSSYGVPDPLQHYGVPAPYPTYPHNGANLVAPNDGGYQYPENPSAQYLPPLSIHPPQSSQSIETFESFQPVDLLSNNSLEINSPSTMFIQAGKCSNSVEVGRTRDVEIRTTIKYGSETSKGVCVLMLYASSEINKLAISLQAVQGTTNVLPKGTWLETNVKMYAVSAGGMQPIFFK